MEDKKNNPEKNENGDNCAAQPITDLFAGGFEDIVGHIRKPWQLMWVNFLLGLARGVGFFLGMTILGALILVALHRMVHLPYIGKSIAGVITEVKQQLATMPR